MDIFLNNKRFCQILLLFISYFISNQIVNAQSYGLKFDGQDVLLDKRTELDLTPDRLIKAKDVFEISFEYKAIRLEPNSNAGLFGYIFRIVNSNDENIDLLCSPYPVGLKLVLGRSNSIIPIDFSDELIGKWIKLRIKFFLKEDKLVFYAPDTSYVQENMGFAGSESLKIIFGANDYRKFKSSDVTSMAIKDIMIFENDKLRYHWPLDEKEGTVATDRIRSKEARVINPSWLDLPNQNWQKIFDDEISGVISVAADNDNGDIFMVGKELLTIYSTQNNEVSKVRYRNIPLFFDFNYRAIYNTNDNKIYCYLSDELSFYSLDINTGFWNDSGIPVNYLTKYRHHNSFYRATDNSIYTFGGYGGHRYKNEIVKIDLSNSIREELPVDKSVFQPRYLSGLGVLNDTIYILGGYGSESGDQLINPHSFFNLIGYSFQTGTMFEKYEIPVLLDDMVVGNKMWIDSGTRAYYALIYNKVKFENHLQLLKGNIDNPEVELVGDKIPFRFHDVRSYANLYYMPLQNKLYAYVSFSTDSTTQIKIYSINHPPTGSAIDTRLPQKDYSRLILYIGLAVLFIIGMLVFFIVRRNKAKNRANHDRLQVMKGKPIAIQNELVNRQGNYNLIFFGGFQVFNKQFEDITTKFSPLLKELFLLILLNTYKNNKGLSSVKMDEILWNDKSEISARNNRAVNIAKLKRILNQIGECELTKETGYWKINFTDTEATCDYLEFLKITSSKKHLNKQTINSLMEITQQGPFLLNLQYEWLDDFKATVSDRIVDTLVGFGQSIDVKGDADFIIHLADSVFHFDSVNEEAMILKCKAQYCMGKHSLAKATYEKFYKEFKTMYCQEYDKAFLDIIKS